MFGIIKSATITGRVKRLFWYFWRYWYFGVFVIVFMVCDIMAWVDSLVFSGKMFFSEYIVWACKLFFISSERTGDSLM